MGGKPRVKTCDSCKAAAAWVRCTQFSGDHFFCHPHAELQQDFRKENPSYFFWVSFTDYVCILDNRRRISTYE